MNDEIKKWLAKDGENFLRGIGIRKGQTVLDFGCNKGHYTIPAAKVLGKQGKVYAFDKDKDALIEEIEAAGFTLEHKFSKELLHDDYYNKRCILNLRKNLKH